METTKAVVTPNHFIRVAWQDGRAMQLGWLCFLVAAVVTAWMGLAPYLQRVPLPCDEVAYRCFAIQFSSAEMDRVITSGINLQPADTWIVTLNVIFAAIFALLVAAFGMWRRPTYPVVACMSFVLVALATSEFVYALALARPGFYAWAAALRGIHVAGLPLCFLLVPDSRFHPAGLRWGALFVVTLGWLVVLVPVNAQVAALFAVAVLLLCGGTLLLRYRDSQPTSPVREQVVWAMTAFLLFAGAQIVERPMRLMPLPAMDVTDPLLLTGTLTTGGLVLLLGGIACLAVAALRDELTQLELVFNRTLVYGFLTLFVIGSYGLIVGSLSLLFQAAGSFWLSVIATGLVAVLFQPLRVWVQRFVNQLLYGQRDEPLAVLARLGEGSETAQTVDALLPELAKTIGQALKLPYVAIALRQVGEIVPVAEFSATANGHKGANADKRANGHKVDSASLLTIPLIHQRETIGELCIAPRSPDEPFSATERELLMNVARQVGAAVRAVQLTADLQQSRQRLVEAIEEERRRLRRDLHDGLGPVLAALILQSETASELVRQDPAEAEILLVAVADQAYDATQEIRRLVYNLRPPALDDLGLVSALRAYANRYATSEVSFEICAPDALPSLPAAVEVAVYRIATEAMTNVIRHAHAARCWLSLEVAITRITLTVKDDGQGMAVGAQAGVGVLSMRERCAELGGTFTLTGNDGVQIQATLPL